MHREEKKERECFAPCVCLCQHIAGVFCRLDFTASVRADIPLVSQWMSYLGKGQWRFAKINHSCFSHSTPVEKKSLPSSGVTERERETRVMSVWHCKQNFLCDSVWSESPMHAESPSCQCVWHVLHTRKSTLKKHVDKMTCWLHEPQQSKWCPYECWQAQWDDFIQHDNKSWNVLLLWHLSIVLL